jgi:hypothetical protein
MLSNESKILTDKQLTAPQSALTFGAPLSLDFDTSDDAAYFVAEDREPVQALRGYDDQELEQLIDDVEVSITTPWYRHAVLVIASGAMLTTLAFGISGISNSETAVRNFTESSTSE